MWTVPIDGEPAVPAHRIIHARVLPLSGPTRVTRLGLKPATMGYSKCVSFTEPDWLTAFRVLSWDGRKWRVVLDRRNVTKLRKNERRWFDLGGIITSGLIIEGRQCGIDLGWTEWNLMSSSFVLEGSPVEAELHLSQKMPRLSVREVRLARLPRGISMRHGLDQVRYRTKYLEVGFRLNQTGFTHLALDDEGRGRTSNNLLCRLQRPFLTGSDWWPTPETDPLRDRFAQGLCLHPVGNSRLAGFHEHFFEGTVSVDRNVIDYDLTCGPQRYRLRWEVLEDRLLLSATRIGQKPMRAWTSSIWQMSLDSTVTPCATIGRITRRGEVGLVELPLWFHAPGQGSLRVTNHRPSTINHSSSVLWRADSWRCAFGNDPDPHFARITYLTTAELKLGEQPQPTGDYLLPAGRHRAEIEFVVAQHRVPLHKNTPPIVRAAVNRCSLTALTYRPDTATLSNNSTSIHAILCADNWSAVTTRLGKLLPNLHATELLRDTLERHLSGGPSYGGGRIIRDGKVHCLEDEYLMTGTALLLAAAELGERSEALVAELERMRARDVDGDGLVESPYRLGISRQHQPSTNWYDVLSFGWKDAFANALLYPALVKLGEREWAEKVRTNYYPAFFNPRTGWLAGWRCKNDRLHDYAFLYVNGAAVCGGLIDPKPAREIMARLWREMQRVGPPDYRLGLPGNLWSIPYKDSKSRMPFGDFENGGLTHAQARHFVGALYKVGMRKEGDTVLHAMLESLADGTAFSGCGSGVEWRRWDGAASGYEGLLTDQFGILAVAIDRYGRQRG